MTIQLALNENDFLTYHLYSASKSDRIKKKRNRNKVMLPLAYLVLAFLLFNLGDITLGVIFLFLGLLWFLFYPMYETKRYIKHFQGHIKDTFKNRIDASATIQLDDDFLSEKSDVGESKIKTTEIEEINEIDSAVYIKLKTGESIILPKNVINNMEEVIIYLKKLASQLNVNYNIETDWIWK